MSLYDKLREHIGHSLTVAAYGDCDNLAIECEDCYTVLIDVDKEGD